MLYHPGGHPDEYSYLRGYRRHKYLVKKKLEGELWKDANSFAFEALDKNKCKVELLYLK